MRFSFAEEHDQFRATVRRFLDRHATSIENRRLMDTADGYDPHVWQQLSRELGLTALHIPESYGGGGFGLVELSIAAEEMGRSLLCAPYFSSAVLATNAILNGGTKTARMALLPDMASGERRASFAITEPGGRWDLAAIQLTATARNGDYALSGTKKFVLDGHTADVIIVAARNPATVGDEGLSLFSVDADAPGLQRRLLTTIDSTRKQAELTFEDVPAILISELGHAATAIAQTLDQAAVVLANEMVGGAQALLDSALDFAKLRMQFGRTIGSFQAIKHQFSDLLLHLELAKASAYYAAAALAEGAPDSSALASHAKATAAQTYMDTATAAIQLHGGIGFTWDHDTHLWYKRAKSSEVLLGDPSYHRERYMQLVAA